MTKALAAIHDATYGGVYYSNNIDFTNSAVQPTWTLMPTIGLANTSIKVMQNDPFDPYNDIYVQLDNDDVYHWNGASWDKIMDLATARTSVGQAIGLMGYITLDRSAAGTIYIPMAQSTVSCKLLKSTNYGSTWSVITVAVDVFVTAYAYAQCYGQNLHVCMGWLYRHHVYSTNGGANWTDQAIWANTTGGAPIRVDPFNPTKIYYRDDAANFILVEIIGPATKTTLQNAYVLGSDVHDRHWIDPLTSGHQRILRVTTDAKLFATTNSWTNLVSTTPTQLQNSVDWSALAAAREEDDYILYGKSASGTTGHKVWAINGETSGTTWGICGTNVTTPPYTNAIPGTTNTYVAVQGLFVGEAPASSGVYVYADELGDITDIPSYDGLGAPLFGDRASWRDRNVDGFDIYHAEDVERDAREIHTPQPTGNDGYGIVEVGGYWVNSSDEIALDSDLHDPVTLDVDAALILDLQGGGQEIGLDVQNANTVFAGPVAGPANEPTFRALDLADLPDIDLNDLADVDTTGVADGDALIYDTGTSTWIPGASSTAINVHKVDTIIADTTLNNTYDVVVVDATAGDVNVNLPGAALNDGLTFFIKRIDDSANDVTVIASISILLDSDGIPLTDSDGIDLYDSSGAGTDDFIDGESSQTLGLYDAIQIVADADAGEWWIV